MMQSVAILRCCIRRFSTDIRCPALALRFHSTNGLFHPQRTFSRSISLSVGQSKKRTDPEPQNELIKNKGGGKRKFTVGYNNKKIHKTKVMGTANVWRNMTVAEFAKALNIDLERVQEAMLLVKDVNNIEPNARIEDFSILNDIAKKCGFVVKSIAAPNSESPPELDRDVHPRPPAPPELLKPRPPVVTVMGHVDHGKTTLLDTLRGASVAEGEAGGITQHIGAFTVTLDNGERVTFLDTPGHAAFSSMRARGAHCTDIIVLVVAAEDGVMQQTREVIQLAKDAKVPIIVAINKIDLPNANIEAAKRDLLNMGIQLEGHGGDVQCVNISALHGTNLDLLAESITTQATLLDLKSEYTGFVEGIVIESKTDPKRGKLSTAIVTRGTLRKGASLVGGLACAKVRGMFDHNNEPIQEVTPGMPVEILGWRELPLAGDHILEVEDTHKAHAVVEFRTKAAKREKAATDLPAIEAKEAQHMAEYLVRRSKRIGIRNPNQKLEKFRVEDPTPRLNIILKGDVHGSVEAILDVLDTYHFNERCRMSVVHYGVGEVTEGDMELARGFNAIIYAFSIRLPAKRPSDVVIRRFNIIYRLIEDLQAELNSRMPDRDAEDITGEAIVQQVFHINEKNKKVAVLGCKCTKGMLKKSHRYKLLRGDEVIFDGDLSSMRHLKNEVDSIKTNVECGLQLADKYLEPEEGDRIVCYTMKKVKDKINWNPGFQEKLLQD